MSDHTLEQGLSELEGMIKKLEDKDLPLEEAFEIYKKGMDEIKLCQGILSETEKAVKELMADGSLSNLEEK